MSRKPIYQLLAFCAMLCLILAALTSVLSPKGNGRYDGMRYPYLYGFLSEPKRSIDLMMIGNSNVSSGFSPMELWGRYGYTSYVSGEIWQNMVRAVSILKDAVKHQSPRIVMLDSDELYSNQDDLASTWLDEVFPFLQYHDRWKVLELRNMFRKPEYTTHYPFKGQKMNRKTDPYVGDFMLPSDEVQPIPFWSRFWLDRFAKICRDRGITLILVAMPSARWNYRMHNAVQRYADANDLRYIDMNIHAPEAGFDWKLHTRDKGEHLNNAGAAKVTAFMGQILKEHYSLKDHRGDPAFSQWDTDYQAYLDFMSGKEPAPEKTDAPRN